MKLTDSQLVMLSKAAQRSDHYIELPKETAPVAAEKLVAKLAGSNLIEEIETSGGSPVWRIVKDQRYSLRITDKGMEAIGIAPDSATTAPVLKKPGRTRSARENRAMSSTSRKQISAVRRKGSLTPQRSRGSKTAKAKRARQPTKSRGTKIAQILNLLSRKRGVTIDEIATATGWQAHSVRGALSGAIRKKLGHRIITEKHGDRRHYRINGARG